VVTRRSKGVPGIVVFSPTATGRFSTDPRQNITMMTPEISSRTRTQPDDAEADAAHTARKLLSSTPYRLRRPDHRQALKKPSLIRSPH